MAKGHRNPYDDWNRGHAGIGGLAEQITIKGGTIYAEGSDGGPGIGNNGALGSSSSDPVHISITGGQVTAVGKNAPGIGNGEKNLGAAAVAIADGLKIQEGASESQLTEVSAAEMAGGASKPYVEITPSVTGEPSIRILSAPKAVYRGEQTQFQCCSHWSISRSGAVGGHWRIQCRHEDSCRWSFDRGTPGIREP